jgi:hypothetical protein
LGKLGLGKLSVRRFSETGTDTLWLSTWLYMHLFVEYQKFKKLTLVCNCGFSKKSWKVKELPNTGKNQELAKLEKTKNHKILLSFKTKSVLL